MRDEDELGLCRNVASSQEALVTPLVLLNHALGRWRSVRGHAGLRPLLGSRASNRPALQQLGPGVEAVNATE